MNPGLAVVFASRLYHCVAVSFNAAARSWMAASKHNVERRRTTTANDNTARRRVGKGERQMKRLIVVFLLAGLGASTARAQSQQPAQEPKPSMEIYGFAMLDMGHDFKQIHPDWYDTLRVTKLPSFEDEFGKDNRTLYRRPAEPARSQDVDADELGDLKTTFEFELFGTGVDSGQTTFRLRHAWGELGQFAAGQYWSPFTDPDAFPNSLEYWGPTGLAWYRNVQFRWTPVAAEHNSLMFALERPGASGDQGAYADRIELQNITPRFPVPDFTAAYKRTRAGATRASRASCAGSTGTTCSSTGSISRARHRLGPQFLDQPQGRREGCHSRGVRGG